MGRKPEKTLLTGIEEAALDPRSDVPSLLRKCITLGGITGSERLRSWAALELKGYGQGDDLPDYRLVAAPLVLDGATVHGHIKGQAVPASLIPEFARDKLDEVVPLRQPVAEIADLVQRAQSRGDRSLAFGVPGGSELVALINHELGRAQVVERIYWEVSISPVARVLDVVRTILVELVAEMRAGMGRGDHTPSHDLAERAFEVAVQGNKNRVVQNVFVGSGSAVMSGNGVTTTTTTGSEPESRLRTVMWWIVGISTVIAAVVGVVGFLVTR